MTNFLSAGMGVPDAPKKGQKFGWVMWSRYQSKPSENEQAH